MVGLLFVLLSALVIGTLVSHLVGLGDMGWEWHIGIGLAGMAIGWLLAGVLPLPGIMRIAVNQWSVYPVWATVGTLGLALVVALARPSPES